MKKISDIDNKIEALKKQKEQIIDDLYKKAGKYLIQSWELEDMDLSDIKKILDESNPNLNNPSINSNSTSSNTATTLLQS